VLALDRRRQRLSLGASARACALGLAATFLFAPAVGNAWAQPASLPAAASPGADYRGILGESDEEDKETYIDSYLSVGYRHDRFPEGLNGDEIRFHWQQSFGPSSSLAAGIEIPFIDVRGEGSSAAGIGDIHLDFRGMISKGERFEQAAGLEVVAPSASHELLDDGQTVLRLLWGFSGKITRRTTLDGEASYSKAVSSRFGTPELNHPGGELILTRAFTERFSGFLDSKNYYEFSLHGSANTLKIGAEVLLDREKKWGLSPYVLIPFTQAARHLETSGALGLDLRFKYPSWL